MKAHEAAEEQVVHPLAQAEGNADTVNELVDEEMTAAKVLEKLEGMDVDSAEFEQQFAELKRDVLSHARQEERDEHPRLLEDTAPEDLERRGKMFENAERDSSMR
jgi:hypothetical protein